MKIIILENDVFAGKVLTEVLAAEKLDADCSVMTGVMAREAQAGLFFCVGENTENFEIRPRDHFQKPVRLGALLDALRRRLEIPNDMMGEALSFGSYSLAPGSLDLHHEQRGESLRLTEKERGVLACLVKANGAIVERGILLEQVWGYAENIETHTLETHIYRLRQKIEVDPSTPEILLTQEPGYRLVM
jgi:DNA-binding response OmpR family regulator